MDMEGLLDRLAAPARRALEPLDLRTLEDLARLTRKDILKLHGMGPKALKVIDEELRALGLEWRPEP